MSARSIRTKTLTDGFQLDKRFPVTGPIQGFLRADKRVQVQYATDPGRQTDLHAVIPDLLEVAHRLNGPQAIQLAQIDVQIEALQVFAVLNRELQGKPFGCHSMRRVQVCQRLLESHQIVRLKSQTDINILSHERAAMSHCRKPPYDYEVHPMLDQARQERLNSSHAVVPSPVEAYQP
jgi:hypothetical protein